MKMRKKIFIIVLLIALLSLYAQPISASEYTPFIEFQPQYEYVSYFVDEKALATSSTERIVINPNNDIVFQSQYEHISYKNSYYRIYNDNQIVILDMQQQVVCRCDGIASKGVINNRVAVTDDNLKQTLYNLNGEVLLTDSYDDIIYGNGDCILLDNGDGIVMHDLIKNKNIITGIEKCTSIDDNYAVCVKDDKYGIIDFQGNVLIDFKYSAISRELSSEYFYCLLDQTIDIYNARFEKVGSIDISKYNSYKNLSEGLVCVRDLDGNYSYVDVNGKTIIDNLSVGYNLNNCAPFYEGLAVISTANGSTYINKNGALATDRLWDGAYRFANGYALVYNNIYDETNDKTVKQWYIINNSFEVVKTLDYDVYVDPYYAASTDFSDGSIRTIDNETGLMGFIYLENYSASSNNQLKLSPTSLYQIDRESQTLFEVFKDTTVKDFKNQFLNDTDMLSVIDADGNALSDDAYVVDGCKVQLKSKSNGTTIIDELTIKVSEKATETDSPTTDPNNPIDSDNPKNGTEKSNQWFVFVVIALLILILVIVFAVIRHKLRYFC